MRFVFSILMMSLISFTVLSQDDKTYEGNSRSEAPSSAKKFDWNKVSVGGNFGGNFNNNQLQVQIAPIIGYQITEKFTAGAGPIYEHIRIFGSQAPSKPFDRTSIYGAQTITRYDILESLFLEADFQWLNYEDFQNPKEDANGFIIGYNRNNAFAMPLGGGYSQRIGLGNARFRASVLYDVLWSQKAYDEGRTPYAIPFRFQFGITTSLGNFGF